MADTYKFKTPDDLELLEKVPATANAIVEVDGDLKRVPGDNLGGGDGGIAAIWKMDIGDSASVTSLMAEDESDKSGVEVSDPTYTAVCDNMTYDEFRERVLAGTSVRVRLQVRMGEGELTFECMDVSHGYINSGGLTLLGATFLMPLYEYAAKTYYWFPDGTITEDMEYSAE